MDGSSLVGSTGSRLRSHSCRESVKMGRETVRLSDVSVSEKFVIEMEEGLDFDRITLRKVVTGMDFIKIRQRNELHTHS